MKTQAIRQSARVLLSVAFLFLLSISNNPSYCSGTFPSEESHKGKKTEKVLKNDGPYIFDNGDGSLKIIEVGRNGKIEEKTTFRRDTVFKVTSHSGRISFTVRLHETERQNFRSVNIPERIFVTSDPHGNIECFTDLLKDNGITDRKLEWKYGSNTLIVIGDVFDRGNDATQIFWLLYKLENEAKMAGGQVIFLLGNHEPMILSDDMRYAKDKYKILADTLGIRYSSLYGPETVLGQWLATRNTIHFIGRDMFVHAGVGEKFLEMDLDPEYVNRKMSEVIFMKNKDRKAKSALHAFLYGSEGPVWYRGLVREDEKYNPCPPEILDRILSKYGIRHVIVGHTIFDDICSFYDGKVIAVNVDNKENTKEGRSRALIIENGVYRIVGNGGKTYGMIDSVKR